MVQDVAKTIAAGRRSVQNPWFSRQIPQFHGNPQDPYNHHNMLDPYRSRSSRYNRPKAIISRV